MIKKSKKSVTLLYSILALSGCEHNIKEEIIYDNSLLKKWYNIKDQEILAERELGPNDYKNYDFVVPFIDGKWTKTSYVPIIEDLFMNYIGFKESWPEHKKKHHLEHYTLYLEDFLKQIGRDADINKDNIVSKEELEELKRTKFIDS